MEQIGRGQLFSWPLGRGPGREELDLDAVPGGGAAQPAKTGALIAFQRKTGLHEYIETGVKLDALISTELLLNIFEFGVPSMMAG